MYNYNYNRDDEEFVLAILNKTLQVEDETVGASRTIATKMSKKNHKFVSYFFSFLYSKSFKEKSGRNVMVS
jgi:hypothetical protein